MRVSTVLPTPLLCAAGIAIFTLFGFGVWFKWAPAIIAAPAIGALLLGMALGFNEIPWIARSRAARRAQSPPKSHASNVHKKSA